jgi:hypothetical protein
MIPEFGIYLGGSSLEGKELLEQLAKTINSLAGENIPPAQKAVVKTDEIGPMLTMSVSMYANLTGRVVGGNNVVLATSPFFLNNSKTQLMGEPKYLIDAAKQLQEPAKQFVGGDYLFYINTDLAIQLLQPWYPMAAQQLPGASVEEIGELADLLKTGIVSLQYSSALSDHLICSRNTSFTVH